MSGALGIATVMKARLRAAIGEPCPWCANIMGETYARFPTRDHVVPKSRTSKGVRHAYVIVCLTCNQAKRNYTLSQWLDRLRRGGDPRAAHVEAWMAANDGLPVPKVAGDLRRVHNEDGRATLADVWPRAQERASA